jgi:hypothetical protein
MDYVYLCRNGENEELRYSLRSLEENAPEGNVWVVGGKPGWYIGNYIYVPQTGVKYQNARSNLKQVCFNDKISNDIVLMNDDFFIVKPVDSIEMYHGGLLEDKVDAYEAMYPRGTYTRLLTITFNNLLSKKISEPLDYELHVPMRMEKDKLIAAFREKTSAWRSIYGNMYSVGGTEIRDVKVYTEKERVGSYDWKNSDFPYLSSMDASFNGEFLKMLQERFPNKSKYEA